MKKILLSLFLLCTVPAQAATNYCDDASAVGCWGMESDAGETDLSGNSADLTEVNTVVLNTSDFKFGLGSRDCESGDSDRLTMADGGSTDLNGANQKMSIALWLKVESQPSGTNLMWPLTKYRSSTNQRQYGIVLDSANSDFFSFNISDAGTAFVDADSASTSTTATWVHWAFVYNDTDMRIYKNGVLEADVQAHTAGIFNGSEIFMICGSPNTTPGYYDGLIDDVIILGRDLSITEVNEIMTCGMEGAGTAPGCQAVAGNDTISNKIDAVNVLIN